VRQGLLDAIREGGNARYIQNFKKDLYEKASEMAFSL
jgi:hypothetical protein